MDKKKNYNVVFSGLKLGKHTFEFEISQAFFDLFTFEQDFENPKLHVELLLEKKTTFLDLHFDINGTVDLICDVTNELYSQPIQGQMPLVVKFGHEYDDTGDEVWVIPHGDYEVNVSQIIYELVLLSIPNKRVNPDLASEKAQEALDLLDKYAPKIEKPEKENDSNDPRWDSLKDLLK